MSKSQATDMEGDQRSWDAPRVRACLRCRGEFESQWFGERICRNCKNSAAWRSGLPYKPPSSGRNR